MILESDAEFFLDYLFIQNNFVCIYNICLNSSTLFENQVALIIKKLLSQSEDISKLIKKDKSSKDVLTDSKYNRLLDDSDIYDGYVYNKQESTFRIVNQEGFSI